MRIESNEIESLLKELHQLHLRETEINERINAIEVREASTDIMTPTHNLDRDSRNIHIREKVIFLTKGNNKSTGGLVRKLSYSPNNLVAISDEFGNGIQRKSCNIRVVEDN